MDPTLADTTSPSGEPTTARLCLAVDVSDAALAETWFDRMAEHVDVFKVGLELFVAEGPSVARAALAHGACFLDLKLHDIPATMAKASARAAALGVDYLTVHASAGPAAIEAVRAAVEGSPTRILAVTALTSLDASTLERIGLEGSATEIATRLGRLAIDAGAHGLVCSAHECGALRELHPSAELIVPGIRPAGSEVGDQKRVATPAAAVGAGATMLVVGRPIREADDPVQAARSIRSQMQGGPVQGGSMQGGSMQERA